MPLEYKGYTATIDLDPEDGTFSGRAQSLRGVIHFEGTDGPSLLQAFRDGVDDYLAFCAERAVQPDTPAHHATDRKIRHGGRKPRQSPPRSRWPMDSASHQHPQA
ncbi:MAG TPA: hypothetical protein VEY95_04880 [Azospirillaceae bacterium]|nr:hypothetical protein [Azospirillaceae bacterium]